MFWKCLETEFNIPYRQGLKHSCRNGGGGMVLETIMNEIVTQIKLHKINWTSLSMA
jgi:hypothetical protein